MLRRTPRFVSSRKRINESNKIAHLKVEDIKLQNKIDELEEKIKEDFSIILIQYKGISANGDRYYEYSLVNNNSGIFDSVSLTFKITKKNKISLYMIDDIDPLLREITEQNVKRIAKMTTDISELADFALSL
jgi:hypothetical protein